MVGKGYGVTSVQSTHVQQSATNGKGLDGQVAL
jgi:hypothetical protein